MSNKTKKITKKNLYNIIGFHKNSEYRIIANDIREAVDIYHDIVGSSYDIKEIICLFEVYL